MKTYRITFTLNGSFETTYVATKISRELIARKLSTIGAALTHFEESEGPGHSLQNFVTYVESLASA